MDLSVADTLVSETVDLIRDFPVAEIKYRSNFLLLKLSLLCP